MERSIPELSKLRSVPFALQNRALFEGKKMAKMCREKGRKRGGQQRGKKEKRTRENRSVQTVLYYFVVFPQIQCMVLIPVIMLVFCDADNIARKARRISKLAIESTIW